MTGHLDLFQAHLGPETANAKSPQCRPSETGAGLCLFAIDSNGLSPIVDDVLVEHDLFGRSAGEVVHGVDQRVLP